MNSWAKSKMFYALHNGEMSIRTFLILYYGYPPKLVDEALKETNYED